MEKIIATEITPHGLDNQIILHLEQIKNDLGIEESVLYYGFPVFKDYEDYSIKSKIALLSKNHGLILIQTTDKHSQKEDDDNLSELFSFIEAAMKKSKILRKSKKELHLDIHCVVFGEEIDESDDNETISSLKELSEYFKSIEVEDPTPQNIIDEARSIIEGAKALSKQSKRNKISDDPKTKLNILIDLEKEISNFDIEQRKIAISLINGPQRIRGLAGSGKTIVLAMKAAHIHLQHSGKKILFTFYTKSLYGLIRESIARFYRHFSGTEPNWENIDVLHSWGGRTIDGVIYNTCADNSIRPMTFSEAKLVNSDDPFKAVCHQVSKNKIYQKYDYILIDEAQDLPNEFFSICYKLAKGEHGRNKNIVWAYDELQSIFNVYQRTPKELFGLNPSNKPLIDLDKFAQDLSFGQSNDLVLYKCYRNPLEVLLTAHALGFGVYSERPVQMLENEEHWKDVGYRLEAGSSLVVGQDVTITRDRENSPLSIYQHQEISDVIECHAASNIDNECQWIVSTIIKALDEGLKAHDVLVICLDDMNAKHYFTKISYDLSKYGVRSNNLLIASSAAPPFTLDDMVTLSTVHRAKGNEAPLVFAAGIDALFPSRGTRNGRNKIFTAFTRTKAWLKISGIGSRAQYFFHEVSISIKNSPSLKFTVPDARIIETIQRDLSSQPNEFEVIEGAVSKLIEKGYTQEQIQMKLGLVNTDNKDE
ncbi:MAG: ATP-binding domain-containing protein [Gammaproteobacteria bacterium]|nr:ATP-binding domain-containing protein [Gammaproteobacteria bacterium]MBU1556746.1 ATP-binding domain-containing protein [Gammaproteobacteria bacterium]MBU2070027.1 ATP-binding domain-containing protein [Gammaproteobacteria bacterium]MBU2183677.1 ATP-binding domain-containing protein [Gammaproteobacteria bacterium]MBU2205561.1 ATP-binding domain-containing protein [Gammaproteobacteria bacterium]